MEADAIRMLEVSGEDIRRTNVSNFVRLFGDIARQPEAAKQLRGKIVLGFRSYDSDPRPNWAVPEIRNFVQALDKAVQYFPYFLVGDPAVEHILFYFLCLVPFGDMKSRLYSAADLLTVVARKAKDVTRFCEEIEDDPERATDPFLLNLPAEVVKDFPDIADKILDAMSPALRALEGDLAQLNTTPEGKAFVNNILSRATTVCGIDRSKYTSDISLLREVLSRANRVSNEDLSRFEKSFDECTQRLGNRKLGLSTTKLRQVVRQQRRAAYRFVEIHLLMAASQPGYLQPAAIVATALLVEFDDPGPMRRVEQRGAELGANPEQWMPGVSPDFESARAKFKKS
jgi:hypothetical protein